MLLKHKQILQVLDRLEKSRFRASFKLTKKDIDYLIRLGWQKIEAHARDFIVARLAPPRPKNDGRQTPFKGHPVFVAQHATATCCRKCLNRWHKIPAGRRLRREEAEFMVSLIMAWLIEHRKKGGGDEKETNISN